jgi:hypothetical protein
MERFMMKKMIMVCLSAIIIMATNTTNAFAYTPQLPKTPTATSVVVLDLTKDLSAMDWNAKEAYMVSVVIQGLVIAQAQRKFT